MKKITRYAVKLLLMAAVALTLLLAMPTKADAATVDDLTYEITDGEVTVSDCELTASGELVIPDTIDGCPVTMIGAYAFQGCSGLTSVTIPDSVTIIDDLAFSRCSGLIEVTIGNNVTGIGRFAFESCPLTSVTIPDSVIGIDSSAFEGCSSLTEVTIGNNVSSVGDYAFFGCSSLKQIIIPKSVTSIGNWTFCRCSSLTEITIPDSVTSIGQSAFAACKGLTSIYFRGNAPSKGNAAFSGVTATVYYPANDITWTDDVMQNYGGTITWVAYEPVPEGLVYEIVDGEVTINDYTGTATELTVPGTIEGCPVTTIGEDAFKNCTSLTEITIPDSVTDIGESAFESCDNLTEVILGNGVTSIGNAAFRDCVSLANITLPDGLTTIGEYAFRDCDSLTSISIPGSVAGISSYAFSFCDSLTEVVISEGVTAIESDAFLYCGGLTEVTLPDTLISIGSSAFRSCQALTQITIPDSVTNIGESAFSTCTYMEKIIFCGSAPEIGDIAFDHANARVYYPANDETWTVDVMQDYGGYLIWMAYDPDPGKGVPEGLVYQIMDGEVTITSYFGDATELLLPDTIEGYPVTTIGAEAFYNCTMTNVVIPDSVITIEGWALWACENLTNITIPESVTSIGLGALRGCDSLKSIIFRGNAPEMEDFMPNGVVGKDPVMAYYPADNVTWTFDVLQPHGGNPDWIAYGQGAVKKWNLILNDELNAKFYLNISNDVAETTQVQVTVGTETVTYDAADLMQDGQCVVTATMAAAQMTDDIVITVISGGTVSTIDTYSVRQYADTILADDGYSLYHGLIKEMLSYGAAAQVYFGHKLGSLADEGITGAGAESVPDAAGQELSAVGTADEISFYAASLVYRDKIAIRFYFDVTGSVEGYNFTAGGKTYTPMPKDGHCYIEVPGILPEDLDQQVELTATDANGNTLTVSYSPMNYIVRMNQKGSDSLKALVKALYNYHLAAKALFAQLSE